MHAASRAALDILLPQVETLITESADPVITGSALGTELFQVAVLLDENRSLRTVLTDGALTPEQRTQVITDLFASKLGTDAVAILNSAVSQDWSNAKDFRNALVELSNIALLKTAEQQKTLSQVEEELFQLARLLEANAQFEQKLIQKAVPADARKGLLSTVIHGKVTPVTEAMAQQVIVRPVIRPVEDLDALCELAASQQGRRVAKIQSAQELSESQTEALAKKLETVYGTPISIHATLNPSLIGGVTVHVGYETIDGSIAGQLNKLRTALT